METYYLIKVSSEQEKLLKPFLKALNAPFNRSTADKLDADIEKERILNSIERGFKEAIDATKGRGTSRNAWDLVEEL
jgi:hypothetical protein